MKNFLILLFSLLLPLSGCKDNSFKISGKLNDPVKGEYLYIKEIKADDIVTADSVMLGDDGLFSFEGEISIPTFYMLTTTYESFLTILAEPGENISVEAGYHSLNDPVSVKGSAGTEKMLEYNKALKGTIEKLMGLREIYMQNSDSPDLPSVISTIDSTAGSYLKELNAYTKNYIDKNLTSLVSLVALYQQVDPNVYVLNPIEDIAYFVKVDSSLYKRYPESEPVKSLHEQVKALVARVNMEKGQGAATASGTKVPEIELPDPEGNIVKLSSTLGNIVLLDFWAAWCPPCRRENPNLVDAYNKYKSKGFQIYQVSLDKTKEDWVRGIEQDKLGQWIHVSDLKYWNSMVVPMYNIQSIPYSILLDREGNVIASNLRGEQLHSKLAEVFKSE